MANPSVKKVARDSDMRGLQPSLAAGSGTGDFGAVAGGGAAVMSIADPDVKVGMQIFAQIEVCPDLDIIILKAIAAAGSVVITVKNTDAVNAATAGNTKINYFAR